jgi:hypothetical protein
LDCGVEKIKGRFGMEIRRLLWKQMGLRITDTLEEINEALMCCSGFRPSNFIASSFKRAMTSRSAHGHQKGTSESLSKSSVDR